MTEFKWRELGMSYTIPDTAEACAYAEAIRRENEYYERKAREALGLFSEVPDGSISHEDDDRRR